MRDEPRGAGEADFFAREEREDDGAAVRLIRELRRQLLAASRTAAVPDALSSAPWWIARTFGFIEPAPP